MNIQQGSRRKVLGWVVSNKMDKTIVVQAFRLVRHKKYGKYYKQYNKFKAHDEKNECSVGDRVQIIESKPISKDKKFRLQSIIERVKKADFEKEGGASEAVV